MTLSYFYRKSLGVVHGMSEDWCLCKSFSTFVGTPYCARTRLPTYFKYIHPIIHQILYNFGPYLIILGSNSVIIFVLVKSIRRRSNLTNQRFEPYLLKIASNSTSIIIFCWKISFLWPWTSVRVDICNLGTNRVFMHTAEAAYIQVARARCVFGNKTDAPLGRVTLNQMMRRLRFNHNTKSGVVKSPSTNKPEPSQPNMAFTCCAISLQEAVQVPKNCILREGHVPCRKRTRTKAGIRPLFRQQEGATLQKPCTHGVRDSFFLFIGKTPRRTRQEE